jgi:hypothetical protein
MFKITAPSRDIEVSSFKFYTHSTESGYIQVYSRSGAYNGYELNSNGWDLVHQSTINLLGPSTLTEVNLANQVTVPSGLTKSFFLWVSQTSMVNPIKYDAGTSEGDIWRSDSFVELYQGVGVTAQFSGSYANNVYSPRYFSGSVR